MEPRRSIRWYIVICQDITLATLLVSCAAGPSRSSAWVIENNRCHIWAEASANQQYLSTERGNAAAEQSAGQAGSVPLVGAAAGLSVFTEIARQSTENDLYRACMQQAGFAPE